MDGGVPRITPLYFAICRIRHHNGRDSFGWDKREVIAMVQAFLCKILHDLSQVSFNLTSVKG